MSIQFVEERNTQTMASPDVLIQAFQYHLNSIITIFANFYSHEELCAIFIELSEWIISKLQSFGRATGHYKEKAFSLDDDPDMLNGVELLVRTIQNTRRELEAIKILEHPNFFDRLKISDKIGQIITLSLEKFHGILDSALSPAFQGEMMKWAVKEKEAHHLDQLYLKNGLTNLLQLLNERRTDIPGVMRTLIPLTRQDLATKSQLVKALSEGGKAIQSLKFTRELLPTDHPCHNLLVQILNRASSLCASGQAILEDTSIHPTLFDSFPSKLSRIPIRVRKVTDGLAVLSQERLLLRHYDTYSDLIRAFILKPRKERDPFPQARKLVDMYIKDDYDCTQGWKFLHRNKRHISEIVQDSLRENEGQCDNGPWMKPIIVAFIWQRYIIPQAISIECVLEDEEERHQPYHISFWEREMPARWHDSAPSVITIHERDASGDKYSNGVFSRCLPPIRMKLYDHLLIPKSLKSSDQTLPSTTAQASSLKLIGFLIACGIIAESLEYMAICVDIATQCSLELAAQARLLVTSLNYWVQKRCTVEPCDFMAARALRRDFKIVADLFKEITDVQDRRKLLTSWEDGTKQKLDLLYNNLFSERYYWSQMEVEKGHSQHIHETIIAMDSWDIAAQLYQLHHCRQPKSLLKKLTSKVGLTQNRQSDEIKPTEHYVVEYK